MVNGLHFHRIRARTTATPGVTLAEYGLIGSVILGISVVAVVLLGKTLNGGFAEFADSLALHPHSTPAVPVVAVTSPAALPPGDAAGPPDTNPPPDPTTRARIVVSKVALAPLSSSVMTMGANGATHQLADNIRSIADAMKASGQLTDAEYNILVRLANQGHVLGTLEGLVEQASHKSTDGGQSFAIQTVKFKGETYTIQDLVNLYGWSGGTNDINSSTYANPETLAFLNLRDQALQSSALNANPTLKKLIEGLSTDILDVSNASDTSASWAQGDGLQVDSYQSYIDDLPSLLSSQTHFDASTICNTTGGADSGIQCQ